MRGQRGAVGLARGPDGQLGQQLPARRQHVRGQPFGQSGRHRGSQVGRSTRRDGWEQVSDELGARAGALLLHKRRRDQTGVDGRPLDLLELDPETAQLDLAVASAEQLDGTGRECAYPVPGAIYEPPVRTTHRLLGEEPLGRQLGAMEVAEGDTGTADAQLALLADAEPAEVMVEHVQPGVRKRIADRHPVEVGQRAGSALEGRRERGRLGGSVGVQQSRRRRHRQHSARRGQVELLAPDD